MIRLLLLVLLAACSKHTLDSDVKRQQVQVTFNAVSEVNVSRYVVQLSADGKDFRDAGIAMAFNLLAYSIKVEREPGEKYGRIRAVDNDGKITDSKIYIF
jgi:hypothetical protein